MKRSLCNRKGARISTGSSARLVPLALFIATVALSPTYASAQAQRKDSNAKAVIAASDTQQITSGKELFHEHCASCHFTDTTAQKIGPGLKGLYARLTFSDGKKVSDVSLTKWIEAGGKDMPGFRETMKPEQIRALVSYIKTL